ncbi:MAG: type I glutamate--ammonia ligase [Candidatus Thermoplasmatota archaeon]
MDIIEQIKRENVKFVLLQFMDILGNIKSVSIPAEKAEKALNEGMVFDGSSVLGYATIDESDMRAHPDPTTFKIFPWTKGNMKTAMLICDIYDSRGKEFLGDPRNILRRTLEKVGEKGYIFYTGPEYEFFLFQLNNELKPTTIPIDKGTYFDLMPLNPGETVNRITSLFLDEMGFDVEAFHHEVAPGQFEIDLRFAEALQSADRVLALKYAIKTVALEHGLHATFMPKPIYGINGSGMHVHQSLFTLGGENAFYKKGEKWELSKTALWYIGGILKYAKETCAILAPWVNSYKRLVPGYEAPVYISWANLNRSALIRVPQGREAKTRIEVRNPDPSGNPYLQYLVMLAAGLKGIEEKLEPPEPVEMDIYKLSEKQRKEYGVETLPSSLGEALMEMKNSELVRSALGEHIFEHYLYIKRKEWEEYRCHISDWEINRYLPVL